MKLKEKFTDSAFRLGVNKNFKQNAGAVYLVSDLSISRVQIGPCRVQVAFGARPKQPSAAADDVFSLLSIRLFTYAAERRSDVGQTAPFLSPVHITAVRRIALLR